MLLDYQQFKLLDLKTSRLVDNIFLGNYKTAFKGSGIEFADIREYVAGDSFKYIDWLTSAKQGKLFIKKYEEERQLTIFFLIDIGKSMGFSYEKQRKIDTLLQTFYLLAFAANKNNDKIGAVIYDDNIREFIKPSKGKLNIFKINKSVNSFFDASSSSLSSTSKAINFINNLNFRNSLVFVLTDDMGYKDFESNIYKMAGLKNDVVYINIFDFFENNLDSDNNNINIGGRLQSLEINTGSCVKQAAYRELRKAKIQEFKGSLNKVGIDYLLIDDKVSILKELLNFFKIKGARH